MTLPNEVLSSKFWNSARNWISLDVFAPTKGMGHPTELWTVLSEHSRGIVILHLISWNISSLLANPCVKTDISHIWNWAQFILELKWFQNLAITKQTGWAEKHTHNLKDIYWIRFIRISEVKRLKSTNPTLKDHLGRKVCRHEWHSNREMWALLFLTRLLLTSYFLPHDKQIWTVLELVGPRPGPGGGF